MSVLHQTIQYLRQMGESATVHDKAAYWVKRLRSLGVKVVTGLWSNDPDFRMIFPGPIPDEIWPTIKAIEKASKHKIEWKTDFLDSSWHIASASDRGVKKYTYGDSFFLSDDVAEDYERLQSYLRVIKKFIPRFKYIDKTRLDPPSIVLIASEYDEIEIKPDGTMTNGCYRVDQIEDSESFLCSLLGIPKYRDHTTMTPEDFEEACKAYMDLN